MNKTGLDHIEIAAVSNGGTIAIIRRIIYAPYTYRRNLYYDITPSSLRRLTAVMAQMAANAKGQV